MSRRVPGRRGRDLHCAAIGLNGARILDQGFKPVILALRGNGDLKKPVTGKIERHALARAESDKAKRRLYGAGVADLAADQSRIAAADNLDSTRVLDRCGCAVALEDRLSGHEIIGAHVEGRGNETAGADMAGRPDENAVRVHDKDPAIRVQLAVDLAGGITGHAVQDRGIAARLPDIHAIAPADGKCVPVDHGAVAALGDRHGPVARRADLYVAMHHLAASGQRVRKGDDRCQRRTQGQRKPRHAPEHGLRTGTSLRC